jgi:hypothetical protein
MKKAFGCFGLAVALSAGVSSAAQSQSDEAVAAAVALILTPAGSFASVSPAALGNSGTGFGVEYGRYSGSGDRNAFGVHADWRSFRGTIGIATQADADNVWMLGLSGGRTMFAATALQLGLEGNVGYGRMHDSELDVTLTALTAGARFPLSISLGGENATVVPYLAPGAYFGRISAEGESESGVRGTLNGGVRIGFNNGLAVEVGAQKIFIDDAETLFGIGLSFNRR